MHPARKDFRPANSIRPASTSPSRSGSSPQNNSSGCTADRVVENRELFSGKLHISSPKGRRRAVFRRLVPNMVRRSSLSPRPTSRARIAHPQTGHSPVASYRRQPPTRHLLENNRRKIRATLDPLGDAADDPYRRPACRGHRRSDRPTADAAGTVSISGTVDAGTADASPDSRGRIDQRFIRSRQGCLELPAADTPPAHRRDTSWDLLVKSEAGRNEVAGTGLEPATSGL